MYHLLGGVCDSIARGEVALPVLLPRDVLEELVIERESMSGSCEISGMKVELPVGVAVAKNDGGLQLIGVTPDLCFV